MLKRSVLVVGLMLAACGRPEAEYQAKLKEIERLTAANRALTDERSRLGGQLTDLRTSSEASMDSLRTNAQRTQTELEAARQREQDLLRLQRQAEERLAAFRSMVDKFRAMISAGRLRVSVRRNRLIIDLPAGILFESGEATLRREGTEVIRGVAQVLKDIPDRSFLVAGHTDNVALNRGSRFRDNWELSTQRAVVVARAITESGVAAAHVGAAGYGEFGPAVPNTTDANRASNRRVEIILMPNMNELPDLSSLESDTTGSTPAPNAPAPNPTAPTPATPH